MIPIVTIYHPQYSRKSRLTIPMFIDEFLPDILVMYSNILMVGDFNFHLDNRNDPDAVQFSDILDAMGLIPHIDFPTHIAGHTLGQVYTMLNTQITISDCSQGFLLSDHYIIKGHVVIPRIATSTCSVRSRKIKGINSFMDDIKTEIIPLSNIDEVVRMLDIELFRVLDKTCPDERNELLTGKRKNPEKVCKEHGGSLEPV